MRNIIILVLFAITMNTMIGWVMDFTGEQEINLAKERFIETITDGETRYYDMKENKFIEGSQREDTNDLLPPIDTNPSITQWIGYLWQGLTFGFLDDNNNYDNQLELMLINILKFVVVLINIGFVGWAGAFMWAKVVHT